MSLSYFRGKKMRLLSFLLLILPFRIAAQQEAQQLLSEAAHYYDAGDYEAALSCFSEAKPLFKQSSDWTNAIQCAYNEADCLYELGEPEASVALLNREISFFRSKNVVPFEIAKSYLLIGFIYDKSGEHTAALQAFEEAITIYNQLKINHHNVAYAYKQAGQIYLQKLDYEKTIAYFEKGLQADSTKTYQASLHALLAETYFFIGQYDRVLEHYEQGIRYRDHPKYIAMLQKAGGEGYLKKGDYQKAEQLIGDALRYYESKPNRELWKLYHALANVRVAQNQPDAAAAFYQKAFAAAQATYSEKDRELAKLNCLYGDFLMASGKLEQALEYYHKGQVQAFQNFDETDVFKNPTPDDLTIESWQMSTSARKGWVLKELFKQKGDLTYLQSAAQAFDLSLAAHVLLRNTYCSEKAKLYLGAYNFEKFESAIVTHFLLFERTGDATHLDRIFQLMEQSKAEVLEEKIEQLRALAIRGLPDTLLREEAAMRGEIADLKIKMLSKATENTPNVITAPNNFSIRLNDLQEKYTQLFKSISTTYPDLDLLQQEAGSAADLLQRAGTAADSTALLEFFYGEQQVFVLSSTHSATTVARLGTRDSVDRPIRRYLAFFENSAAISNDVKGFSAAAFELFQTLFPPTIQEMMSGKKNWIIIPDGLLNFVPFDALMIENEAGTAFSNMPFLIKKHNIRLAWSGYFIDDKLERNNREWQFYAPIFETNQRTLSQLRFSPDEKGKGTTWHEFNGNRASASYFKILAPQARVLHLSTHATAGESPRIELFDRALLLDEIYAMILPCDLVVLSACQTNLGTLQKGEGVQSLARGFSYAGAASLVASLWSVNEQSTARLFARFYDQLTAGYQKSGALRQAKLRMLEAETSNHLQSPYYWAGFVFYGTDGPLPPPDGQPIYTWALVLGIPLTLFFWYRFRKNNKSTR